MKETDTKITIVHNIIAPYKIVLFNELAKLIPNLYVIFIAESESRRDWKIDYSKIKFNYQLMFNGNIDNIGHFKMAQMTWKTLTQLDPHSLIICDYSKIFGWISLLWGKLHKSNLAFWLDSTIDDRKHYFPKEQIKKYFLKHFSLYLSPGVRTQEYLNYMGANNDRIENTGYAVDNTFYIQEKDRLRKNDINRSVKDVKTKKNFIYVGRISQEKNILLLLNAFKNVTKNNQEWGLMILGDGPQKSMIEEFIEKNNLKDLVFLIGFVQQDEIVKYYLKSDVFVLPSKSEPWGLVVNEALLCELPVIISDRCGSGPELVVEGENGFTFDPSNQAELERIMADFIDGKIDFMEFGKKSFSIIQEHSPENVALKIEQALKKYKIITS